jgi:putative ABC transport system ATP-binding protein
LQEAAVAKNTYTETENIIEIKDLRKVYKVGSESVVALNNINITIKRGEICCFLGTSGSGKSTLLNMMAGLERPTKGTIRIAGWDIDKLSEKKLAIFRQNHIGFIFQSYNLMPFSTALENVAMPLIFRGVSRRKRTQMAKEMLIVVGLEDRMLHKPSEMSGGQQQRVGIARAFVARPEIIFADEPTGNLDSRTSTEIMNMIVDMAAKHNQTLIIVTHDMNVAKYAHRIFHMLDGDIEKIEECI